MRNPISDKKFLYRVRRGGSGYYDPKGICTSNRYIADSLNRNYDALGFRVVRNR